MADLVNKQSDNPEDEPRLDEATLGQKLASLDARSQGFQYSHTEMETITLEDGEEKGEEVEVPKGKPVMKDMSYHELEILQEYTKLPLVSKRYDQFEPYAATQEWVVVIGGETEGISGAAIKFTHAHLGERIFVPLRCEIDSLNVVSATSVILFEIQRQLERKLSQEQSKSRENMT